MLLLVLKKNTFFFVGISFFGRKFLGSLVVVRFEWFQQNQTNEEKTKKQKFIEILE